MRTDQKTQAEDAGRNTGLKPSLDAGSMTDRGENGKMQGTGEAGGARAAGWHVFLILYTCLILFPIAFAVSNSFKTSSDAYNTILELIPRRPTLDGYRQVFAKLPFVRIALNTFLIAVSVTVCKTMTSLLAAYSFVFFQYKGKKVLYFLMLITMFTQMGLRDNIWGVALPQMADVLGIFLLRQAMRGIPKSLVEAAKLDNIPDLKIMKDIIMPLVRPAVISTGIIFFINSWNEYVWPVLILKSVEHYTLPLALQMYISAEGGTDFPLAMAVSVLTMLIPLVLYLIFQKYIISTFAMTGVKG